MSRPLKILLVGDSDSQLLACEAISRFRCKTDVDVQITVNVIPRKGTPRYVLDRVARLGELWSMKASILYQDPRLRKFDAIGVFLTGSKIAEFRDAVSLLPVSQRPLLFCGFNGVVLERFEEGISWRLGYDLICLNGPRDEAALKRLLRGTPFEYQRTVLTGMGRSSPTSVNTNEGGRPKPLLVFAEQVVMPTSHSERQRMVRILAELARRSPNWDVVIKPRVKPTESTFHRTDIHISKTLRQTLGSPPVNLRLDYTPLPQLLAKARLLATISSTAFFDALDHGCRSLVMADFGPQPSSGCPVFYGSGVEFKLDEVEDLDTLDAILEWPKREWLSWIGYSADYHPSNLIRAIRSLRERPAEPLRLDASGYIINTAKLSFSRLRLDAENAIQRKAFNEAGALLELAQALRPDHRNVAKRLRAVRSSNQFSRRLRLMLSSRFMG